jgi:Zn-dependent protease
MFGVEVSLDWSWILTFVLAAWTLVALGARVLPRLGPVPLILLGVASATGLLMSLVLHEVVHGVVSRACGVPVRQLTLFLVGGITDVERQPASPKTEVLGAIAAPLTSLAIAVVCVLAIAIAYGPLPSGLDDLDRLGAPGVALAWLAIANVAVAGLNLLPAFPLDGGRLLRAAIWRATGDVERATRWSAWSGQVVGWLLLVLGVSLAFGAHGPGVAGGIWVAFIGWFVASAAAQGYEGMRIQDALAGVPVARLMRRSFVAVPADLTVTTAVRTFLARSDGRPMPVVDGHAFVGLLSFRDVRELPQQSWSNTLARDAARRSQRTITPRTLVVDVLELLGDVETERVAVVESAESDRLVGMLDRHDVTRWLLAHARGEAMRQNEAV